VSELQERLGGLIAKVRSLSEGLHGRLFRHLPHHLDECRLIRADERLGGRDTCDRCQQWAVTLTGWYGRSPSSCNFEALL
jgi:hypothetical protein